MRRTAYRRHDRFTGLLIVLFMGLMSQPAHGLDVPPLGGRVNDHAAMLSPGAERELEGLLQELEASDGTQIVVLTVPSLAGDSLEEFSIRVAEQWQIGQEQQDNGAILLIAAAERKVRIEVGYGLEGRLTDLMAGRIIADIIVPHFKAGRIDQGVLEGVAAMVAVVRGEYTADGPSRPRGSDRGAGGNGLFGLFLVLFILNILSRLRRSLGAVAGAVVVPLVGTAVFGFSLILFLALIPVGVALGLLVGLLGGPLVFGSAHHRRGRGGFWMGGGGGFGGGGFGGFSGGGGGFGGGGASGGW